MGQSMTHFGRTIGSTLADPLEDGLEGVKTQEESLTRALSRWFVAKLQML
jgi:hypothetical protein